MGRKKSNNRKGGRMKIPFERVLKRLENNIIESEQKRLKNLKDIRRGDGEKK